MVMAQKCCSGLATRMSMQLPPDTDSARGSRASIYCSRHSKAVLAFLLLILAAWMMSSWVLLHFHSSNIFLGSDFEPDFRDRSEDRGVIHKVLLGERHVQQEQRGYGSERILNSRIQDGENEDSDRVLPMGDSAAGGRHASGKRKVSRKRKLAGQTNGTESGGKVENVTAFKLLRIPTVFLIGAPKCGTTAFSDLLFQHPRICRPMAGGNSPLQRKESRFFAGNGTLKQLSELFSHDCKCENASLQDLLFLDATPDYMYNNAKQRIYDMLPEPMHPRLRFIALFREPVARDLSWFNHQRASEVKAKWQTYEAWVDARVPSSAAAAGEGKLRDGIGAEEAGRGAVVGARKRRKEHTSLKWGRYAWVLRRWWRIWGSGQTLVLNTDTLQHNTSDTMQRVASFLGVDGSVWSGGGGSGSERGPGGAGGELTLPRANTRKHAGKVKIEEVSRGQCERLRETFRADTEALYAMLKGNAASMPSQQPRFPPFADPCSGGG